MPARLDAFDDLGRFLEVTASAGGLPRETGLRLRVIVEELFTNTVMHGHGGDSDASVTVSAEVGDGRISVVYEDSAPPFDPFAPRPAPDPADDYHIGGHGVALVKGLAHDVSYTRVGNANRISLVVLFH